MIGIYKITNKINDKCYIGASKDIEKRWKEHKRKYIMKGKEYEKKLYRAIRKYKIENFSFEIIEETNLEELFNREIYWISNYDSYNRGYNETLGGEQGCPQGIMKGERNPNSKLIEEDIYFIRNCYINFNSCVEVYQKFKERVTYNSFKRIWQGHTWKYIMPEIYTQENKKKHRLIGAHSESTQGSNCHLSKMNEEDIRNIRIRKRNNESKEEIFNDYKEKIQRQTFNLIWNNKTWKEVAI